MRPNSLAFSKIASWWAASFGAISSCSFCSASLVFADVSALKTSCTRVSVWPLRSSATSVLSKVGGAGLLAIGVDLGHAAAACPRRTPARSRRP